MSRPFLKNRYPIPSSSLLASISLSAVLKRAQEADSAEEVAGSLEDLAHHVRTGVLAVRPTLVRCDDSPVAVGLRLDLARAEDV